MDMGIEDGQPPKDPTVEHSPELRIPTQKDISLREFMSKMDDYAPIVLNPYSPFSTLISLHLFVVLTDATRSPMR